MLYTHMKHLALCLLLLGCGNTPKSQHPSPDAIGGDAGAAGDGEHKIEEDQQLDQSKCEALFEHIFKVAYVDQQASLPEEERPTEADLQTAKDALRERLLADCVKADRKAFHYDCAMEAQDRAAMEACLGEK